MRVLPIVGLLALASCGGPAWQDQVIAQAESLIQQQVNDSSAHFSRVQVTGDDQTGQTCGYVTARAGPGGVSKTGRFIVYIDATAGPFVEAGMGSQFMAEDDFDRDWQGDCVKEGYRA